MLVFDSSTLILLAKVEILDIFLEKYPESIIIPEKVFEECCSRTDKFDALLIKKRVEENKIQIVKINNRMAVTKFISEFNIGAGEAEAIALVIEQDANILALDDRLGINACKLLKLNFTTAIAIVIRLYEKGVLTKEKAMQVIDKLAYYGRYKNEIIVDAKKIIMGD